MLFIDSYFNSSFDSKSKNPETAEGEGTLILYFRIGQAASSLENTKAELAT